MRDTEKYKSIVHIIMDEKWIDMAIREFEYVAPGVNRYLILGKYRSPIYVKSKKVQYFSKRQFTRVIRSEECSAVVFHSLSDTTLLYEIPKQKKVIWLGWGYDYYTRLLSGNNPDGLLLPKTKLLNESAPKRGIFKGILKSIKYFIKDITGREVKYKQDILTRIDYFAPVIDLEYRIARELNPWFNARFLSWNYGTVEDDYLINQKMGIPLGNNIMVGNSASLENNHLEAFTMIKQCLETTGLKIIVPLSYGHDWYHAIIIEEGKKMFGSNFVPLTKYLPLEEYTEILQSCGYYFVNHLRQQALGNICIMILKGAKIFMNPLNPLYDWFIAKGAIIQSIAILDANSKETKMTLKPLSEYERQINIEIIKNLWGRKNQRIKTKHLVDVALRRDKS